MLAGIGAVDLALLVIAADEGVMPQTREHLDILDLLDVRHGIVVLSKTDLVDEEWTELMAEEVREMLAATSLAGAPLVPVSAHTGEGLDALREAIDRALDAAPEPADIGRPRLGIDRVFTMSGFGTVVTGTLLDGRLQVGDTVEVTPGRRTARIRGLQTHRQSVPEALPGSRVAVNLAGVDVDELRRGEVIARPGRMQTVRGFDARVRALPHDPIRHNARVHVHIGSAEVQGRVRVLGAEAIEAGNEGWAQVILVEPAAGVPGDLFVLRLSDHTLGGGRIIEVNPPRHRRSDPAVLERLARRAEGSAESRVFAALERLEPVTASALAREVELEDAQLRDVTDALVAEGAIRSLTPPGAGTGTEPLLVTAAGLDRFGDQVERALESFHAQHPLRFAMPREELRSRLRLAQREFSALLGGTGERLAVTADGVVEPGWTPKPNAAQQSEIAEVERAIREGGMQPPRLKIDPEILAHLEGAGRVVDCGDGVVLSREAFEVARDRVVSLLGGDSEVTLAEARDALETNRRATQAILETFDRLGITRRQGDTRVLGTGARERPPARSS
jgi:selenocysteine-specific elongation factor